MNARAMSTKGVLRPGHVQIRALDMDTMVKHYRDNLGLLEMDKDDSGRVYFKGWDEFDKFSVVIRPADEAGMDFMAFKVNGEECLKQLEKDLTTHGVALEQLPAGELKGCGRRVRFTAPTGHVFELYADKEQVGNGIPENNPDCCPDELKGMKAMRFDHCLLYGDDLDGTVELFREVLGFNLAEQVTDGDVQVAAFLTVSNKAHDVAFIRHAEKGKLHHISFFMESWESLLHAADLISRRNITHDIGPTRHGLTRGTTIYFFDPSGNRNETYAGGSTYYPDSPVMNWDADQLGKAIFYHDRELNERFLSVLT
ncbi:MAG: catechol 2,3-dioxygenase [SAR324 cluster bacterium]|nr:catechol 2,3-dioxygenase [SAR324 cluster bacterium]